MTLSYQHSLLRTGAVTGRLMSLWSQTDPNSRPIVFFCFSFLLYVFLKLNVFPIDWRMITLQYCVCFSRTSIRMNHRYSLCPLPLETPSHLPPHPTPLSYYRALGLSSLCHTTNSHRLSISYMVMCMFSMLLSQSVPPSLSPTVSTSVFSMSASPLLPCK